MPQISVSAGILKICDIHRSIGLYILPPVQVVNITWLVRVCLLQLLLAVSSVLRDGRLDVLLGQDA